MTDKRATIDEVITDLRDGMTIGIGGWGSSRKPMAIVRAIVRSGLQDLTIVTYGGPDVGILCAAQAVRKVIFAFVSLESIPLDPHFRRARQGGVVEACEFDEGMLYLGLLAAAQRLPFLPTRAGLGSDVMKINPNLRTILSPYNADGEAPEEFVAMPAISLDAAFVHVNRADYHGNGQVLGPDAYFDELFLGASERRYMTAEQVVAPGELLEFGPMHSIAITRLLTDAVIQSPHGAHFTSCVPDYDRDEEFQRRYVEAARLDDSWARFSERYLDVDEPSYQAAIIEDAQ